MHTIHSENRRRGLCQRRADQNVSSSYKRSIRKFNTELVDGDYNYDRGINISVN